LSKNWGMCGLVRHDLRISSHCARMMAVNARIKGAHMTPKTILNWYFAPKFFEKNGTIYRLLGIHIFKRFLPTGGDYILRLSRTRLIKKGSVEELVHYETEARIFEALHFVMGILMMLPLLGGLNPFSFSFFVVNLMVNIYPVMVQRYNRIRILNILSRRKK